IFLAFSTAATVDPAATLHQATWLDAQAMDPLFNAVVEAGEEAILESLVVNDTMVGRDGVTARALPHDWLRDLVGTAPLWATPPA
ncbi:MAG: P1 family peptidase, partial [Pseudomonadota bacterium]|nr:P1 family peptidase [Pseudomonadota bacterium]